MPQAFIIVQIGNKELDCLCTDAIVPAIKACGLDAKRVDKHNEGGLLKSEIVRFIEESDIIVADVTNERPNVYLEIGYAMGVDKFRNLVLTVRDDHFPDSPKRGPDGPKIHFYLAGYDILAWAPEDIDTFRAELEKRIRRRPTIITPATARSPVWDTEWIDEQRATANAGFGAVGLTGFMEARAALHPPKINGVTEGLKRCCQELTDQDIRMADRCLPRSGTFPSQAPGGRHHVKEIVAPLFQLFDFFELADPVYEDIVNRFVNGEVS